MVEQVAVNDKVLGSSPSRGAHKKDPKWDLFFMSFPDRPRALARVSKILEGG